MSGDDFDGPDFDGPDDTFDEVPDEFRDADLPEADSGELADAAATAGCEPAASSWQAPEPTGVQAVDDALTPLRELDDLPTAEHVPYYEAAHRHLQDALADLDGA